MPEAITIGKIDREANNMQELSAQISDLKEAVRLGAEITDVTRPDSEVPEIRIKICFEINGVRICIIYGQKAPFLSPA